MARLRRTADARNDLTAIWLNIAGDNLPAADRLMDEIDHTLVLALRFPLMGEAVDHLRAGTRRITVGNYQLFYESSDDGIRLLRVYPAARRIEDLFN
jgi:plasmid stabilization system protein ParE